MVPDAPIVTSSELYSSSYFTPDTVYSSVNRYTMLVDQRADLWEEPYWDFDELLKIGYRYRAFSLSNSTIINSEKFLLNDYDRNTGKASFNYDHSNLNRFGLIYSPEYLTDQDKSIVLNDQYLTKNITPVTILNPDIPIFEKTFTDDGHHKTFLLPVEEDTYDPDLDDGLDLKGSFTIIEVDDSGIIDYNSICDFPEKEKINLYSDLKIVEHDNGGYDAPLATIDEAGNSIPFEFTFIDQYYPDREMRITDYLDFINQVPTEIKYGKIYVLKGSAVIKSNTVNFYSLNIGDLITVQNVPVIEWVGSIDTGSWQTVYKDFDYTLIEIIDFETGKFSKPYKETSGEYNYILTRSKTYAVDVGLAGGYGETGCIYGNLNRLLYLNNSLGFTYGLTGIQASIYPSDYSLSFPDPDPDPYPRNPDNPWIGHPDVSYYDIEPYIIDSKTYITNRTLGVTGIVNTSYIIDAEGESYGYTGSVGVTGPSGSLNLGITGPVEYPDPRELADYDTYMIPSGYTGTYISYSESEYRVQWRNFDQNIILVTLDPSGIFEEDPLNMMDDISDNIFMGFWNVNTGSLQEIRFSGTVITSTEMISVSQYASSYPDGLIALSYDQVDAIRRASDPIVDLPEYHLNDANYQLNRMIVREILADNLMKVTEIRQFVIIA